VAEQEGQQTETEATGAPQKHHYTLNQQVGSITHNEMGEVIHNSEKLAEDLLPVTCPTCRVIWYHTHEFTLDDFDSLSGKGDFVVTDLKELNI
ncbi:hypothetical protein, partial [Klebsiella pneumoniae]|uniref:hypothetical protein n=1 Tax=Klebsiella pneumoniae TaxID=573 RepID=UPI0021570658